VNERGSEESGGRIERRGYTLVKKLEGEKKAAVASRAVFNRTWLDERCHANSKNCSILNQLKEPE
jgi:hypothetical protein